MSEVLIPTWIVPESESHEWLDEGSSVFRAAFAPGLAQRQSYGGLRLKLSRRHTVRGEEKAQLLSALKASRGSYNVVRTKVHFATRGSFPTTELLSNSSFASGTTGWGVSSSPATLSVSDRIARVLQNASGTNPQIRQSSVAVTQYSQVLGRAIAIPGPGSVAPRLFMSDGTVSSDADASRALAQALLASSASTLDFLVHRVTTTGMAGEYFDVPYVSLSRCALVDAGQNLLLNSDDFTTTWTTSAIGSVSANAVTAPDGTTTADSITETATTAAHYITQAVTVSSSASDYCFSVAIKGNLRSIAWVECDPGTGGGGAYFNLNTTSVGDVYNGVSAINTRAYIADLGNSWRLCTIVTRKTSASTTLNFAVGATTTNGLKSYAGSAASAALYLWRGTGAESGAHSRLVQTTSVATSGTTPTGTTMYVKGLPVSTTGLLLPGDWIQIGGELKQVTLPLSSNAAGMGYLEFEPALIGSPPNNYPITIADPMGKFLISNIKIDNEFGTQARVSYDLEHIYE